MKLTVNGNEQEYGAAAALGAFLREQGADPERTAVVVNDRVVRRQEHAAFRLKEGDRVEILQFVGGG